ncbi:MAG TPA: TonB-dependent receptor [Candidatus Acidoferrales bacterium]|nr:TonB-dependent receptor [Candidatus Acidoferrales bacterium]
MGIGKRQAGLRVFLLLAALACSARLMAQQGVSAEIDGTVRDASGAVLPNATVTLRNVATGIVVSTKTDSSGGYHFLALQPGQYSVRAEASGMAPFETTGIVVTIGQQVTRDLTLKPGSVSQTVTVSVTTPTVDTKTPEVAGVVMQQQIATLPINSRQYLSLALLEPGTSLDSSRSFFNSVNVGGSDSFNGSGNIVDGTHNNWDEDGEPRQDIPEDAIQEFKISNAQYSAEYGESTAGLVEVVTKSGTDQFHGDAFEYFRNADLNARGPFEQAKPNYLRNQFGGSFGGPIVKHKIHFFGAFERTQEDDYFTVTTGLPQFYSSVQGTFAAPVRVNMYDGRVDWQLNRNQSLFARWASESQTTHCAGCGGSTAEAAGFDEYVPRRDLVVGHTWLISPHRVNDFRFQYAGWGSGYYIAPSGTQIWTNPGSFPPARINRLRVTYVFPSLTWGSSFDEVSNESRAEFRDTYSLIAGNHSLKFGGEYNYMNYFEENTGNPLGTWIFSKDQPFNPNDPTSIANLTGAILFSASLPPIHTPKRTQYYAGFVQDEWNVKPRLTLSLGLRWERLYGCCNEGLDTSIFPVSIPYIDVSKRGNWTNFAPRLGFAWDTTGTGRAVIRGGYGLYYGHVRILGNLSEYRNYKQFNITISNPAYPDPYHGQNPFNFISSAPANILVEANDYRQPRAQVTSLSFGSQLTQDLALNISGIYNFGQHDRKIQDINPKNTVTGIRPNTTFGRVDQQQPSGNMEYKALYVTLQKRYSHRTQFLASYTYTHMYDNNPLVRYVDPFNQHEDWGPASGERRHKIVGSGSVLLPYGFTYGMIWTWASQLPWNPLAGRDLNHDGFNSDFVPGTTRNSGSRDLNLAAVNAWRGLNGLAPIAASQILSSRIDDIDARISKTFTLHERYQLEGILQAFNLFNTTNFGAQYGAGRVTNALSSKFGEILTARPARELELAVQFHF